MSGHSKWATIKRKKERTDAQRGKLFTKLIKEIVVAARQGGGDPETNPRLRAAVVAAKSANMPADNIKRGIQKGTGELPGVAYEEVTYEGYGPGGVAMLVEVVTDNKNRAVSEIRHIFQRNGGSLGEAGSVQWMFERRGLIQVERTKIGEDDLLGIVLDAGASDMTTQKDVYEIITPFHEFEKVRQALEKQKIPIMHGELTMVPQTTVPLVGHNAEQMLKLIEMLEDHDDVQKVHANFDIEEEVMIKMSA